MNIISLIEENSDILELILDNLIIYDIINLSQVNSYINDKLEEHIHDLDHKCTREIEDAWNDLANCLINKIPSSKYNIDTSGFGSNSYDRTETYNSCITCIKCSVCPNRYHALKVTYIRNSRDVDLLTWYNKDVKMGYTML